MIKSFVFCLLLGVSSDLTIQNKEYWVKQLTNSSFQIRINAIQTLAQLKYTDTIAPLAERLKDEEPQVRYAAIRGLSGIPHRDSLAAIDQALGQEQDSYLKSEMRRAKKSLEDLLKQEAHEGVKEKSPSQ